jgi:hypothetical protein
MTIQNIKKLLSSAIQHIGCGGRVQAAQDLVRSASERCMGHGPDDEQTYESPIDVPWLVAAGHVR